MLIERKAERRCRCGFPHYMTLAGELMFGNEPPKSPDALDRKSPARTVQEFRVFFAHRRLLPSLRAKQHCGGKTDRHTREGGYPVRCGFSIQSLLSLGYWITRLRG
jgi:hypothetical protein